MPKARVGDISLHYEDRGEGEPLVMLHGLGSSSEDWEKQYPALTPHYRVIAPDFRGFGQSDRPPGPYSVTGFADDIRNLLDQLGIERFHLLGYSMGGAVAFELALSEASRVRTLTIVNSQPSFQVDTLKKRFEVWMRLAVVYTVGLDAMAGIISRRLLPSPEQTDLRERVASRYRRNSRHAYIAGIRALTGWSVAERLPELAMPVMMLAAEHDYFPLEEKLRYAERIPDARLHVIPGSRHGTPFEQPDPFNRHLTEFLAAHPLN